MTQSLYYAALQGAAAGVAGSLAVNAAELFLPPLTDERPSIVAAADWATRTVVDRPLPRRLRPLGGQLVHYATGAAAGAVYGLAVRQDYRAACGQGALFGLAVSLVLHDGLVPLLGWSRPVWREPAPVTLRALALHLLFGWGTERARRALWRD